MFITYRKDQAIWTNWVTISKRLKVQVGIQAYNPWLN